MINSTLDTPCKFTIIFSAYQSKLSPFANMLNTDKLADYLTNHVHADFERVVGVYREHAEQSFVVHTNCSSKLALIRKVALEEYEQECILVRQNRSKIVNLRFNDGKVQAIGHSFKVDSHPDMNKPKSYTVLNGTDFYTVV